MKRSGNWAWWVVVLVAMLVATPLPLPVYGQTDHCPPKPEDKKGDPKKVPGKDGEEGWLLNSFPDDMGNVIELWCLKKNSKHGGPEGGYLYRPKDGPNDKAVWIAACVFGGGKNFPTLSGEDKKDAKGADEPNGTIDSYTGFRHLNVAAPPDGKDDWHFEFKPKTGKLKISKTRGAWETKEGKRTYSVIEVVGTDEIDAPSNFQDLKFKGEQITREDAPNSDMGLLVNVRLTEAPAGRWDYTLRVTDFGGSGTRDDPHVGFDAPLRAGDLLTIAGFGIHDPFVTGAATRPEFGGWVVERFSDTFVSFKATNAAQLPPGTDVSGFGFFSGGVPGQVRWYLASGNRHEGVGVVPGPVARPRIAFFQLDVEMDGRETRNSSWGSAELTFQGDARDLLYFNLAVDGSWQVQNVPVLSVEGYGIVQTVVFNFDLGAKRGVDVSEIGYAFTLGPAPQETMPTGEVRATVAGRPYRIDSGVSGRPLKAAKPTPLIAFAQDAEPVLHRNFPNQESGPFECVPTAVSNSLQWLKKRFDLDIEDADITADRMKAATGWQSGTASKKPGADQGWPKIKDRYMKEKGLPVETTQVNASDFAAVYRALKKGCDVELSTTAHTVAVIGMSGCDPTQAATSKTSCTLTVAHDTDQKNANDGTKSEMVLYSPVSSKLTGGGPWTKAKVKHFVVECPKK